MQAAERLGESAVAVERLEFQVGLHGYLTNLVRASAACASWAEIGRSAARGAGVSPTMSRIHEGVRRASTETIREASARAALVRLVAAPL